MVLSILKHLKYLSFPSSTAIKRCLKYMQKLGVKVTVKVS